MIAALAPGADTLGAADPAAVQRALGSSGLWIDVGAATLHLRSDSAVLARQLQAVYAHFPLQSTGEWADVHAQIWRPYSLRRWVQPQIVLYSDGRQAFEPFPADAPLPLFEWGCNWLIGQRLNDLLLLHAGALERDGLALLLPAVPGSGKSTLSAALSLRGWRLLSDEFGAYDPRAGVLRPMLKPVALKNQSIEVIRSFDARAGIGPEFPKTRKGTVAHLSALPEAVARRHDTALPGAVVLPRWMAGSPTRLEPLSAEALFPALAFNAFNYTLLGSVGFHAAVRLARRCLGWQLVYSDLEEALAALGRIWPQVREHQAQEA